jgi:Ring finger domain
MTEQRIQGLPETRLFTGASSYPISTFYDPENEWEVIELQPAEVEHRYHLPEADASAVTSADCLICMVPLSTGSVCDLKCCAASVFHRPCIEMWLQRSGTCPYCRAEVRKAEGSE